MLDARFGREYVVYFVRVKLLVCPKNEDVKTEKARG